MNKLKYFNQLSEIHEYLDQNLKGKHIIIRCQKDEQIFSVFRRNTHKKVVPASTAKVFLLASLIEHKVDLNHVIKVQSDDITKGSGNNLVVGQSYQVNDLMINLMTASSNTSATVLANYLSEYIGSPYVEYINHKNASLGLKNTNLVNEHGLANKFQYTTLDDLTKFLDTKLNDIDFLRLMRTTQHEFFSVEGHRVQIENTYTELDLNIHLAVKTGTLVPGVFNIIVFFEVAGLRGYIVDFYNENQIDRNKDINKAIQAVQQIIGRII